jgi:hypothetical protein
VDSSEDENISDGVAGGIWWDSVGGRDWGQGELGILSGQAGLSKNYCATKSGSPEVELRSCPWLKLLKYGTIGGLT